MGREAPLKGHSKPIDSQRKSSEAQSKLVEAEDVATQHSDIIKQLFNSSEDRLSIEEYRDVLQEKDEEGRNLIHRIINRLKKYQMGNRKEATNDIVLPKVLALLEELVLEYPELLTQADDYDIIPLPRAAEFNIEILFRVVEILVPQESLKDIQNICSPNSSRCLLQDVHPSRLKQCTVGKRGKGDGFEHERQQMLETGRCDERLCWHNLVDAKKVVEKDKRLRDVLSEALKRPSCLLSLITASNFDPANGKPSERMPLQSFKLLLRFCDNKVFAEKTAKGYNLLQVAIRLYGNDSIDYQHLLSIIEALVCRYPESIYFAAKQETGENSGKTAYRLLKDMNEELRQNKFASSAALEPLSGAEELLKETCIGSKRSWDQKQEFLYWDAQSVRQFCLNLSDESTILNRKHIHAIKKSSGIRFETVLDYVNLPYWNPKNARVRCPNGTRRHNERDGDDDREVSDPYIEVLRWLWKCGVRKIFTVQVDDNGPDPHSNAAIRESLKGQDDMGVSRDFKIEVWKWKKFDLCSDTIFYAAPKVRELHLYCSGNTAILRGWACKSGLPRLTSLQKLGIEIHSKNAQDEGDCMSYEEELRRRLESRCPLLDSENIEVTYHNEEALAGDVTTMNLGSSNKDNRMLPSNIPNPKTWIAELQSFRQFLMDLSSKTKQPVKIAVLDDGAKLTDLRMKNTLEGETFRPDKAQYFVGPCSHGTQMVRCIWEVFPMAEIYVARLDDSRKDENQKFTVSSAYKALKWARDMGVDIISMSWTFQRKPENCDQDEENFLKLVQSLQQEVILFGSLPDKGPTVNVMDYAPVGLSGVIKVGSATVYGGNAEENRFADPDFILPGENLEINTVDTVSGSSFSTAYAAGLAGMVLFFLKTYTDLGNPDAESDKERQNRLVKAKTFKGMKEIFKSLCGRIPEDQTGAFFVRPYSILKLQGGFDYSDAGVQNTMRKIAGLLQPGNMLQN